MVTDILFLKKRSAEDQANMEEIMARRILPAGGRNGSRLPRSTTRLAATRSRSIATSSAIPT